jgi:hypothetical protein
VTIGDRGLKKGIIEVRVRRTGETTEVPVERAADGVVEILETVV